MFYFVSKFRSDKSAGRTRPSMTSLASELTSGELEGLLNSLRELPDLKRILEVGTAAGGTLCEIIRVIDEELGRPQIEFCVVDTFQYFQNHEAVWRDNLTGRGTDPDRVTVWKGESSRIYLQLKRENSPLFSFILIDAGHKLKDVIRDTRWLELLEVGGLAAFHDYSPKFPGVRRAVDVFLARNPEFEVENLVGSLLFIRRRKTGNSSLLPGWLIGWLTIESVVSQWKRSILKRLPRRKGCA